MGAPLQLLGGARAFARDFPRDEMPKGYLWDVVDFVPSIVDSQLTGRGKWNWGSVATGFGDVAAGIYAHFLATGDKVLVQAGTGATPQLLELNMVVANDPSTYTWTPRGPTVNSVQNPIQLREDVITFDSQGLVPPQLWRSAGAPVSVNAAHKNARVGTVWKETLMTAGAPGEEHIVRGADVNFPDLTDAASFDNAIRFPTSGRVTALQGMRTVLLVFHANSVQRIRGGPLPNTAQGLDDSGIVKDVLFQPVGCMHPKSIATWNDNCIFADSHGVHITDGATIKNLTSMGGISTYWRLLFDGASTIVGTTFLDYYIVSVRHPPNRPPQPLGEKWQGIFGVGDPLDVVQPFDVARAPVPPLPPNLPPVQPPHPDSLPDGFNTTLICDLNKKQWFRFTNFNCLTLFSGGGSDGMERMWGGISTYARLGALGPAFYPNEGQEQIDANTIVVKPRLETPWYRLSEEGRKRVRFAYLSYDCKGFAPVTDPVRVGYLTSPTVGSIYTNAGQLPLTPGGYTRRRLPVYKFPYGIAFFVEAIDKVGILRIYDLGVEAQASERSRV